MPARNIVRINITEGYFHVYTRGASKKLIFLEDSDYQRFLNLVQRYLGESDEADIRGRQYRSFRDRLELLAFCLMPNHVHLLFFQYDEKAISEFMQCVMGRYSNYFNLKYHQSGQLTESRFKASWISNATYLMHISRYIHLNPRHWRTWRWSSLADYEKRPTNAGVNPGKIIELFSSRQHYMEFLADYEESKKSLDAIKNELANY